MASSSSIGRGMEGQGNAVVASPIPVVPGLENFNVNSLFQIHSRNWDVEVVRDLFSPVDAAIILGIQINQSTEDDYWYWFGEKDGSYSVSSAYKLIQDKKASPQNLTESTFWKKLWSLKVPPKAKDLMWRAVSNCLATRVNLCIKKVLTDSACPLCGIYAETEIHLFVTCQFASSCWEEAAVADASRNNNSFLQWMSFNAHSKDNDKLSRIVMLCWALWSARNDLIWKDRVRNVSDVVAFAFSSLDQYVKAQGKGNIPSQSPLKDGDGSELWKKPLSGIKLNVDAAIFDRDSKHGFGCVFGKWRVELEDPELRLFAVCLLGVLWYWRNKIVHNYTMWDIQLLYKECLSRTQEFSAMEEEVEITNMTTTPICSETGYNSIPVFQVDASVNGSEVSPGPRRFLNCAPVAPPLIILAVQQQPLPFLETTMTANNGLVGGVEILVSNLSSLQVSAASLEPFH
ncbi:hypothetical protein F8388_018008 [Cannabis sativa]|uniref:Reverse transcriptase zinc-binding domain-containing protein n=1 Tax=Cannabis sativa TaxID=3483 RepID=A0A7J6E949_CANSA|nr:hypothetical protein F8388_018008 [Cannabis sativa]